MITTKINQKIFIIACGPGGHDEITVRAYKKINECDVLIGSARMLSTFAPVNRIHIKFTGKNDDLTEIVNHYRGQNIGILVTGDTGIYSLCRKILQNADNNWDVEIIPGISSLQVAFARIKETWEEVDTFSFHGRKMTGREQVLASKKAAVFCDRNNNARIVIKWLFPHGPDRRCFIAQNLTLTNEKVIEITSLDDLNSVEISSYELVILLR